MKLTLVTNELEILEIQSDEEAELEYDAWCEEQIEEMKKEREKLFGV